jgi:hypothetical protein
MTAMARMMRRTCGGFGLLVVAAVLLGRLPLAIAAVGRQQQHNLLCLGRRRNNSSGCCCRWPLLFAFRSCTNSSNKAVFASTTKRIIPMHHPNNALFAPQLCQFSSSSSSSVPDTTAAQSDLQSPSSSADTHLLAEAVLQCVRHRIDEVNAYADEMGMARGSIPASLFALCLALRRTSSAAVPALGLKGHPFSLTREQIQAALLSQKSQENTTASTKANWQLEFFTLQDLEKAVNDDFLDAARGSTDNRKGWKVRVCFVFFLFPLC